MNEQVRFSSSGPGQITAMAPTDFEKAQRAVTQEMRRNNGGRRIEGISALQRQVAQEKQLYIFNVGPFTIPRPQGSLGMFTVPACEEGKRYSVPLVIPGIVFEPVIKNEKVMTQQSDDGNYVADEILGVGIGHRPIDSLLNLGCFKSLTNPPSQKDVDAAKERLRAHFQRMVNEMNDAHAMGPAERMKVQTQDHVMAARYLGYTEEQCLWLSGSAAPANRANCPGCGGSYIVGVQKCANGNCGFILDRVAYEQSVMDGDYGETARESLLKRKQTVKKDQ